MKLQLFNPPKELKLVLFVKSVPRRGKHRERILHHPKKGKPYYESHIVNDRGVPDVKTSTFPNFWNHPLYKGAKEFQKFIGREFYFKITDPVEPHNAKKVREFRWKVQPSDYIKLVFHKVKEQTRKADAVGIGSRVNLFKDIMQGKRLAYMVQGFEPTRASQIPHLQDIFEHPHYVLQGVKGSDDEGRILFIRRIGSPEIPVLVQVPVKQKDRSVYIPDGIEVNSSPISMHGRRPSNVENLIKGGRFVQIYPKITERTKQKRHS